MKLPTTITISFHFNVERKRHSQSLLTFIFLCGLLSTLVRSFWEFEKMQCHAYSRFAF